mmetsp:Transcript_20260/g.64511  ORF Transcript_20260/g.64511 Transcript_20260/m.64511 type:complete len:201 (-) Transcript_20260:39-641(-)
MPASQPSEMAPRARIADSRTGHSSHESRVCSSGNRCGRMAPPRVPAMMSRPDAEHLRSDHSTTAPSSSSSSIRRPSSPIRKPHPSKVRSSSTAACLTQRKASARVTPVPSPSATSASRALARADSPYGTPRRRIDAPSSERADCVTRSRSSSYSACDCSPKLGISVRCSRPVQRRIAIVAASGDSAASTVRASHRSHSSR